MVYEPSCASRSNTSGSGCGNINVGYRRIVVVETIIGPGPERNKQCSSHALNMKLLNWPTASDKTSWEVELSGDQERMPLESIQRYFETGNRYCGL